MTSSLRFAINIAIENIQAFENVQYKNHVQNDLT